MREIKFKAKRKDNNEWVYGYLVVDKIDYCDNHTDHDNYYIAGDSDNYIEVIPETISQYTNLRDKIGVEIYENDKLKNKRYQDGRPYGSLYKTVKWINGGFNINGKSKQWEVIGNIFDRGN